MNMAVYAISDLHLAKSVENKNMDLFGELWSSYMERIAENWGNICLPEDTIIIPGDISWAMYLEEAEKDFAYLDKLPGNKILLKGNHDYWWETLAKLEKYKIESGFKSLNFLHNNSFQIGNVTVCGTRGWIMPGDKKFKQADEAIYRRELGRFRLSLDSAPDGSEIVAAFHYPPFTKESEESEFIEEMKKFNVKKCIFGHIHNSSSQFDLWMEEAKRRTRVTDIEFLMVSADFLRFAPVKLFD